MENDVSSIKTFHHTSLSLRSDQYERAREIFFVDSVYVQCIDHLLLTYEVLQKKGTSRLLASKLLTLSL